MKYPKLGVLKQHKFIFLLFWRWKFNNYNTSWAMLSVTTRKRYFLDFFSLWSRALLGLVLDLDINPTFSEGKWLEEITSVEWLWTHIGQYRCCQLITSVDPLVKKISPLKTTKGPEPWRWPGEDAEAVCWSDVSHRGLRNTLLRFVFPQGFLQSLQNIGWFSTCRVQRMQQSASPSLTFNSLQEQERQMGQQVSIYSRARPMLSFRIQPTCFFM